MEPSEPSADTEGFCLSEFAEENYQGFFHGNPMMHPELPGYHHGTSAVPIPYALWRDDLVTGTLMLCLILLVYAYNKIRTQFRQQTKDFFLPPRAHTGLFAVETNIESQARLMLITQLCVMGGLAMFAYAQYEFQLSLTQISPHWLLSIYVGSFVVFFIIKWIMTAFVNWIFFPKSQQMLWKNSSSYLLSVESIIFFPLLLIYVYFQLSFEKTIWIFLFILLIIKFLLSFKAYRIFFPKSYCILHLFAYLCALELMPLLALWKSLVIVTESLIVKY